MKRLRLLGFALMLAPAALAAQQSSANPIAGAFRSSTFYGNWLVAAFDSIPFSLYGYKPTPIQQSIGYIAQHLEGANYNLCERFSGMTHPLTARDSLADTVKAGWPKEELLARLRASLAFCDSAMAGLTDASLADDIQVRPGRSVPRARLVLVFITDLAEHYSQIANYMRLNGLIPPSALPRGR